MKLVAGIQKGRRLKQPSSSTLRPTSAKVREALFAILHNRVPDAIVLDLYAGTGALGLEALSRGAGKAVFVDHAVTSLQVLRSNILRCASEKQSLIIGQTVERFLRSHLSDEGADRFDLIFVDPPYDTEDIEPVLVLLGRSTLLAPDGILVLEHFSKRPVPEQQGKLRRYRQARYGDTTLSFYSLHSPFQGSSCE